MTPGEVVLRKVDWHVLPLLCMVAFMCSIDHTNLSFAALQLNTDLGFSRSVYGLGSGLFFVGAMMVQLPASLLCARVGAPRCLGCMLLAWGLVGSLFAFMRSAAAFYLLRLLLGIAQGGTYPCIWYHLSLFYSSRDLSPAYATVAVAASSSGMLGGLAAAGLLSLDGACRLRGWQWLFVMEGIPSVLLGACVMCTLARHPSTVGFLLPEERSWLLQRHGPVEVHHAAYEQLEDEKEELPCLQRACREAPFWRTWRIWYLALEWLLVTAALDGMVLWGPLLIRKILDGGAAATGAEEGAAEQQQPGQGAWTLARPAMLFAIPNGLASFCMVGNAKLARRAGDRNWHGALPVLAGAAALATLPLLMGRAAWAALLWLSVAAGGFALMKMAGGVGAFAGAFLIGALSDACGGSYAPAMLLLAGLLVVAAAMHLWFREPGAEWRWLPPLPYRKRPCRNTPAQAELREGIL